jgi:hypothetical protein
MSSATFMIQGTPTPRYQWNVLSCTCSDDQVMGSDVLRSHQVVTLLPRMVVANEIRGRDKGFKAMRGQLVAWDFDI